MMEYKKLGDIATYVNGYAFKPEQRGKKGLPIIRIQDLTGNSYDLGYYEGDYPKKIELNNGDVLISWSASLGVYHWNRGKALLNQHIFKVIFDKVNINKFFFMYAVEYNLKKMSLKTHGATMKHITKKDFDNVIIPFPTLEKQGEIAQDLNIIKRIIEKYNQQINLLDELVKARFVEMFGDPLFNPKSFPIRRIDEVAYLNKGITYSPEDVSNEGLIVLRSSNIKGNKFDLEDLVFIKKEVKLGKMVHENDILMCNRNGSARLVGKVAMIPKLNANMTFGTFMTIIRSELYIYLFNYFQTEAFRQQIRFQTSVSINQISLPLLASVKVPIPPIELQNQFANFVKEVDKSRFIIKSMIKEGLL